MLMIRFIQAFIIWCQGWREEYSIGGTNYRKVTGKSIDKVILDEYQYDSFHKL